MVWGLVIAGVALLIAALCWAYQWGDEAGWARAQEADRSKKEAEDEARRKFINDHAPKPGQYSTLKYASPKKSKPKKPKVEVPAVPQYPYYASSDRMDRERLRPGPPKAIGWRGDRRLPPGS